MTPIVLLCIYSNRSEFWILARNTWVNNLWLLYPIMQKDNTISIERLMHNQNLSFNYRLWISSATTVYYSIIFACEKPLRLCHLYSNHMNIRAIWELFPNCMRIQVIAYWSYTRSYEWLSSSSLNFYMHIIKSKITILGYDLSSVSFRNLVYLFALLAYYWLACFSIHDCFTLVFNSLCEFAATACARGAVT